MVEKLMATENWRAKKAGLQDQGQYSLFEKDVAPCNIFEESNDLRYIWKRTIQSERGIWTLKYVQQRLAVMVPDGPIDCNEVLKLRPAEPIRTSSENTCGIQAYLFHCELERFALMFARCTFQTCEEWRCQRQQPDRCIER